MHPDYTRRGEHLSTCRPTAAHVFRFGDRRRPGRCLLVVADPPGLFSYPSFEAAQAAALTIVLNPRGSQT